MAFAVGIVQGIEQARAQNAYLDACMREKGYGKLKLTAAEAADLQARKDKTAQLAWIETFLAQDWSERIAKALRPAVPPFAPAMAEALVVGGVRLDPAKLQAATGPVMLKQPLLTGPVAYRKVAVLRQDLKVKGILDTRAEAGSIFH